MRLNMLGLCVVMVFASGCCSNEVVKSSQTEEKERENNSLMSGLKASISRDGIEPIPKPFSMLCV